MSSSKDGVCRGRGDRASERYRDAFLAVRGGTTTGPQQIAHLDGVLFFVGSRTLDVLSFEAAYPISELLCVLFGVFYVDDVRSMWLSARGEDAAGLRPHMLGRMVS
jgi:hypothetical protein